MLAKNNYKYFTLGIVYPQQFSMATVAFMVGGHAREGV